MRKTISLIVLIAITTTLFIPSCKKGENDPFLSLKSRTVRLCKKWKLINEDMTEVYTSSGSTETYHDMFTENKLITTHIYTNPVTTTTNTDTVSLSSYIEFKKDGTYYWSNTMDHSSNSQEGGWMWMSKNKDMNLKKKEAIIFFLTKYSYSGLNGFTYETYSGKSSDPNSIFIIDRLSSEDLIVIFDHKEKDSYGNTYTQTGILTFSEK